MCDGQGPTTHTEEIFKNIAMVGYILVYLQNITSIDAESGSSCDTTALKSSLWRRSHSGIPSAIRPLGTRAVYRYSVFAPSVLFWRGLQISAAPAFRVGCDFDVRSTTVRDVTADI